jgi:hypothetical protein
MTEAQRLKRLSELLNEVRGLCKGETLTEQDAHALWLASLETQKGRGVLKELNK